MAQDITAIMAFTTTNDYNRLDEKQQVKLVASITSRFGGVTLTEHMGGYTMDNGDLAVEYSYTLELFGLPENQFKEVEKYFIALGRENKQESILLNGDFIYLNK